MPARYQSLASPAVGLGISAKHYRQVLVSDVQLGWKLLHTLPDLSESLEGVLYSCLKCLVYKRKVWSPSLRFQEDPQFISTQSPRIKSLKEPQDLKTND